MPLCGGADGADRSPGRWAEGSEGRPFVYTTGWASPVYFACHCLMSCPDLRQLMDHAAALLRERLADRVDVVAGTETSGIPFAAWIADRRDLPMVDVRKKPIAWGVNAQIEGELAPDARCLLVDDLTTNGLSKIGAARAYSLTPAVARDDNGTGLDSVPQGGNFDGLAGGVAGRLVLAHDRETGSTMRSAFEPFGMPVDRIERSEAFCTHLVRH